MQNKTEAKKQTKSISLQLTHESGIIQYQYSFICCITLINKKPFNYYYNYYLVHTNENKAFACFVLSPSYSFCF